MNTYIGLDIGATSVSTRPNADGAAANFDAAVSSSKITFESIALGTALNTTVATGVTVSGGTIVNVPTGTPEAIYGYNTTAGGTKFLSLSGGVTTFTFASPIDAFGAYFSGIQSSILETITFSDGTPQTVTIPTNAGTSGGVTFVGFTDFGASISSVVINSTNDIIGIDDVRFHVPEPTSLAAMSLAGIALLRRHPSRRAR